MKKTKKAGRPMMGKKRRVTKNLSLNPAVIKEIEKNAKKQNKTESRYVEEILIEFFGIETEAQ